MKRFTLILSLMVAMVTTAMAQTIITSADELANGQYYNIAPSNEGSCGVVYAEENMLGITYHNSNATDTQKQFVFLKSHDDFFMYSVSAQKFVADNNDGTTFLDINSLTRETRVRFLNSTGGVKADYPLVIEVGDDQLCSTNADWFSQYKGLVTNWNDTSDAGTMMKITVVDGSTLDETTVDNLLTAIEGHQITWLKQDLSAKSTEAKELATKTYFTEQVRNSLNDAATIADGLVANESSTYDSLVEGLESITATINAAAYVKSAEDFSNNAVYTFVSGRGSYVYYDGETNEPEYLSSTYKRAYAEAASDNVNCQWVVYKSEAGKFYMYNIGAGMFVGALGNGNAPVEFVAKPNTTDLTFHISNNTEYPIMISTKANAVLNHSNNSNFAGQGIINWQGGLSDKNSSDNIHKVTVVGALEESVLTSIEALVEAYETVGFKQNELKTLLDEIEEGYYDEWNSSWRIAEGVNNYSQKEGDEDFITAYTEARTYETSEDVEAIQVQIDRMNGLLEGLTINQPEVGKYYSVRCVESHNRLSSTTSTWVENEKEQAARYEMTTAGTGTLETTFLCEANGENRALLAYATGYYTNTHVPAAVGEKPTVIFTAAANGNGGQYNIQVNSRYIYGAKNHKSNHVDSGTGDLSNSNDGYNWWLEPVNSLPVKVSAAGYATLFAPVALTVPTEVKAYTVTINGEWATLNEITSGIIPANTGVVIAGANGEAAAEGTYNFAITTTEETLESDLRGSVATTYYTEAGTYYALAQVDGVVGFYKDAFNNSRFQNNSHKAYLYVASEGAEAASYSFRFGEGTTGVEKVEMRNEKSEIYDLTGRRVENISAPGIYVVNGKKVLVK